MCDEPRPDIETEMNGEWWWLVGVAVELITLVALPDELLVSGEKPSLDIRRNPMSANCYQALVRLKRAAPEDSYKEVPDQHAMSFIGPGEGGIGIITLIGSGHKTTVTVNTTPTFMSYWTRLVNRLHNTTTTANIIRRTNLSERFEEILNAYYAAQMRGENPNLRKMADAAGVNYASLRQAKIRYDRKRL
jgi:hypothetical protein